MLHEAIPISSLQDSSLNLQVTSAKCKKLLVFILLIHFPSTAWSQGN